MKITNILLTLLFSTHIWANIDGTYQSDCKSYSKEQSFKSEVEIKGPNFTSKFYLYDNLNCQNLLLVVDYSAEVNYPTALSVGPIDHQIKSALMIVFDPEYRDKLNSEKRCGSETIRVGTPISIAGLTQCSPLNVPSKGSIIFDMYEKNSNVISFGAHPLLWVETEEKRPVLTSSITYRQK